MRCASEVVVSAVSSPMARQADSERVVAFYNRRGTCEQWIKEGKGFSATRVH
jgi:hypothetical protein